MLPRQLLPVTEITDMVCKAPKVPQSINQSLLVSFGGMGSGGGWGVGGVGGGYREVGHWLQILKGGFRPSNTDCRYWKVDSGLPTLTADTERWIQAFQHWLQKLKGGFRPSNTDCRNWKVDSGLPTLTAETERWIQAFQHWLQILKGGFRPSNTDCRYWKVDSGLPTKGCNASLTLSTRPVSMSDNHSKSSRATKCFLWLHGSAKFLTKLSETILQDTVGGTHWSGHKQKFWFDDDNEWTGQPWTHTVQSSGNPWWSP